jgi:hypothetical protein
MKTNLFTASLPTILLLAGLNIAAPAAVFDQEIPARKTDGFKQAIFRLWVPDAPGPVRGLIVESGNGGKACFEVPEWQEFANKYQMGMLTEFVSGDPKTNHDGYVNGPIAEPPFTQALDGLAATSKHPEIKGAPIFAFGLCAVTSGGFFPWRKTTSAHMGQRVAAFAVTDWATEFDMAITKEPASAPSRAIPGLLFTSTGTPAALAAIARGVFTVNRKRGALWSLAPCSLLRGTAPANPDPLIRAFFEGVITQRMPPAGKAATPVVQLKAADERNGWLGNLQTKEIAASISYIGKAPEAVWLPDEATAKRWKDNFRRSRASFF